MRSKASYFLLVCLFLATASAALAADCPAYEKFLQIKVGDPAQDLLAAIGTPTAVLDGFTYRVSEAMNNLEQATIYRFALEDVPAEIIVSKKTGKILRKQLSAPTCFAPLAVDAAAATLNPGATLDEAAAAVGASPYLWMEFYLPVNAKDPAAVPPLYQVYIWPDASGQLAALLLDGKVVKAEYQPGGDARLSQAPQPLDPEHPRVPRWLPSAPNNFAQVEPLAAYKQFVDIKMGITEAELLALLGPTKDISETKDKKDAAKITQRSYKYSFKDAANGTLSAYYFYFTAPPGSDTLAPDSGILTKKMIFSLAVENLMLPRFIPQGLRGMTLPQLEAYFGGPGRIHEVRRNAEGKDTTLYGWGGKGAFFAMEFPEGSTVGTNNNSAATGDKNERGTRYEEYVVILP